MTQIITVTQLPKQTQMPLSLKEKGDSAMKRENTTLMGISRKHKDCQRKSLLGSL